MVKCFMNFGSGPDFDLFNGQQLRNFHH